MPPPVRASRVAPYTREKKTCRAFFTVAMACVQERSEPARRTRRYSPQDPGWTHGTPVETVIRH
jgi:hypothetical protein